MNTRTLIAAGILLILVTVIMLLVRGGGGVSEETNGDYTSLPTDNRWTGDVRETLNSPDNVVLEGQQLVLLGNTDGERIAVPDFRGLPTTEEMGSGFYQLKADVEAKDRMFGITYASFDNSFSVGLARTPLHVSRQAAEVHLKEVLGLSEEELCTLRIQVMVPAAVEPRYTGQNLGLSFCPGSVALD